MLIPSLVIQVVDNDPEGKNGGTRYLSTLYTETLKESVEWTILQAIGNHSNYKRHLYLETVFKEHKKIFEEYQLRQNAIAKVASMSKRDTELKEDIKNIILNFLPTLNKDIQNLVDLDSKLFHSIVGRTLKYLSNQSLIIEPLSLSKFLKETISKGIVEVSNEK